MIVKNIGFVSTRFAGTDGVTLESSKWAEIMKKTGILVSGSLGNWREKRKKAFLFLMHTFNTNKIDGSMNGFSAQKGESPL
jgi:hypothetical protein